MGLFKMSLLSARRFRPKVFLNHPVRGNFAGIWPVVASASDASDPEKNRTGEGEPVADPESRATEFSATPFGVGPSLDNQGPRILILDDEISVRRVCNYALRASGWRPEGEGSAPRALERIRAGEIFDVVVLDYAMPEMNGLEFLQVLGELPGVARPAILMASAHADGAVAKAAMQLGVWDFLAKPLMPDDIRRRTRRLLNRQANAARGEKVAAALLQARQCQWQAALDILQDVASAPAPLLRGLFHEMQGNAAAAQQEYARAYWSTEWSDEDADIWSELSRRLDVDD